MAIDYRVVGMDMAEVRKTATERYIGARKRGKRPPAIMVWGAPGIGKTMTLYAVARDISKILGVPCEVYVNATSCLEPTDVAGVPTAIAVDGVTRYTSNLPPKWAYLCSEEYEQDMRKTDPKFVAPPAILFFDDIVAAHPQTQTAFFKGVHEGHWGDLRARDNVMVVAAGNRMTDNAGAHDMPTALASRFLQVYGRASVEGWVHWAQNEGAVHPFVVGYVRKHNDDLHEFNEDVASREDKAFACPRTWEMVSDLLHESTDVTDSRLTRMIFGTIGLGVGTKFMAYMKNTNAVVSPEEICKNPKKAIVPKVANSDALFATISSLEYYLHEHPEKWEAGAIYAQRSEMLPDFGLMLAATCGEIIKRKLSAEDKNKAFSSPVLAELFEKYDTMLSLVNL